ncbi:MAG: ABC transporter permease [Burkholderiales bacterium]
MRAAHAFQPPAFSLRCVPVWRRNFLVWKKLAIPSVLGNLLDPMFYMFGLGYGLGSLIAEVEGSPYINFVAAGTVCYSTMNSATFEALYSAFSRMHVQKTWEAMLNAPLNLDDVLFGEFFWAASKSLLSGVAILLIIWTLGLADSFWLSLWIIPIVILIGLCFSGLGLVATAVSPSYEFFLYYFTLLITPMVILSGVFFPVSQLPLLLQHVSAILPLSHAIMLVRPLTEGVIPANAARHVLVLLGYGCVGFYIALALTRRRLLK